MIQASLSHGRLLQVVGRHHHLGTKMPSGGVHPINAPAGPFGASFRIDDALAFIASEPAFWIHA